jgi:hypothetical protein
MQTSTKKLLEAIAELPQPELDDLVQQVLYLRARRQAPSLDRAESDLLITINQTLTPSLQARFDQLVAKRQAYTISDEELQELIDLTDQAEQLNAERMMALAQLAQARHQSLKQVMQTLGIKSPECV